MGVVCVALIVRLVEPGSPLAGAIAGSGLALPFLLFLFLVRRMGYVKQRPFGAAIGSGTCLALTILGLYVLRRFDGVIPFSAFLLVGVASLAGSFAVLRQIGVGAIRKTSFADEPAAWTSVLRENWRYGRWMVGSTILYSISGQVQMFFAAGFLGIGCSGNIEGDDAARFGDNPSGYRCRAARAAGIVVRLWTRADRAACGRRR